MATCAKHCFLITRDDMGAAVHAAVSGDDDMRQALILIGRWIADTGGRPPDKAPVCLNCDTVFGPALRPDGFMVLMPFMGEGQAIVSGICPRCCDLPDLWEMVQQHVRDNWPGVQTLEIGRA
jgi:hypothetical protein